VTDHDHREALRAAGAEFQAVRASLETARNHLQPLMVAALKAGISQTEVVKLSGYTRDRVRVIARANGIKAEGNGRPKRSTPTR
jgi:hypothetical protein